MKIDGVGPAGKGAGEPKKVNPDPKGSAFETVLKETMAHKSVKVAPVSGPVSVMPLQSAMPVGSSMQSEALSQLEALLGDIDLYRNTLANSDVPLSRLEPMTDSLMGKKDNLVSLLAHVDDPEIRDLITQTAALVINENSRFHSV